MRRRDFITFLAGAAVAWPGRGQAESATKVARVGFLSPGSEQSHARDPRAQAFYQTMRELGWVEGTTITYERRFAEGLLDRLPELARELAQSDVAAIATASTPPALAAKAATSTIPIVIMDPGDPVAAGLVRSLSRRGGNVTGITDGLENDGLVVREVDTADRRVFRVKLSAEGQRQFRRMAAEHEQWVIELFEGMTVKRKNQLVELLGDLKRHIRT